MNSAARREGAPSAKDRHWKPDHRKARQNEAPKTKEGAVEIPIPTTMDEPDELMFGGAVAKIQKENAQKARIEEIKRAIEEELEK